MKNTLDLLDEFRGIALNGLRYAKDPFDLQRYERMLELLSDKYEEYSGLPSEEVRQLFRSELSYITPKVGVQCALVDEQQRILLEQRQDDGQWGLPSGWLDAGETPEEGIIRELKEETGLTLHGLKMLTVYSRKAGYFHQPYASVHILYLATSWTGVLQKSFESKALSFMEPDVITNWHKDHEVQVRDVYAYLESPEVRKTGSPKEMQ